MISIVILTKNEEKNIVDCLETALWADEIVIVDDFSEDRTVEVVKNFNNKRIKVYKHNLDNNFSEQRNFALSKTTKPWVLFLDADERITADLKDELNTIDVNRDNKYSAYFIKREDIIWNKKLKFGETANIKLLRLAKRGSGAWVGKVHEEWKIDGNIGELEGAILHYPHQSIKEFLSEINFYSTLRAQELFNNKFMFKTRDIVLYPLGKFLLNYFVKLGIFDGTPGLLMATMMSFHSFLVRGKLWQLWQKN